MVVSLVLTLGSISGLNWVLTQARASGRPSVVSMSLGGGASSSLDNAVASLTAAGVHVVVCLPPYLFCG